MIWGAPARSPEKEAGRGEDQAGGVGRGVSAALREGGLAGHQARRGRQEASGREGGQLWRLGDGTCAVPGPMKEVPPAAV